MRSVPIHRVSSVLQKGLWSIVCLALATLWVLALAFSAIYKDRLISSSTRELEQMNGMVSQHTLALFKAIETDLHVVDHWLQSYKGNDPLNDPVFVDMVNDLRTISDGLVDIRMVSTEGKLYYIPSPKRQALADVSDRAYYRVQLGDGPRKLHIGDPVLSRVTGKWGIPISWRMQKPVVGLHVIFAVVELDRLVEPHNRWRFPSPGSILVLRDDGTLLSLAPFDSRFLNINLYEMPGFGEIFKKGKGSYISDSIRTDGVTRIVSVERLEGVPLGVVVTRGLDEALGNYYQGRRIVFGSIFAITLTVLGFSVLISRTQKSLLKARNDLERLASIDDLTQVMTRRVFFEHAEREFARAKRQNEMLSVLMLDIDSFKSINDICGHGVGDLVLSSCAKTWAHALRGHDYLGRLGGEEFCVLLPETDAQSAVEVANRLRKLTEEQVMLSQSCCKHVTVSIGVACLTELDSSWQSLLNRADQALYRAKNGGRNRVET